LLSDTDYKDSKKYLRCKETIHNIDNKSGEATKLRPNKVNLCSVISEKSHSETLNQEGELGAIQITTLSENTANIGCVAEWGLSILITTNNCRILLDTGINSNTTQNADRLGIDLSTVDKIVLSHGHFDHSGGLHEVLRKTGEIDVIGHPDIWDPKYARVDDREFYAGIPFHRLELESLGARFLLTREPVTLGDGIMTTGEIPMVTDFEKIDPDVFVKKDGTLQQDPLADDLALVIETDLGLIVILGCAHRGIINTLYHAQNLTGKKSVYAAIGGAHLFRASEIQIDKTVAALKDMGIKRLGLSHCTGFNAACRLFQEMPDAVFMNNAGTRTTLPY
jgi:7,8-dihydropterin-6-yl-methyl-4-(beta-D-ribofuranosyl)aminobenzene 5'-phosphate synthase